MARGGWFLEKQQDQSVGFQAVEDCCWKGRGGSVGGGESQGDGQETRRDALWVTGGGLLERRWKPFFLQDCEKVTAEDCQLRVNAPEKNYGHIFSCLRLCHFFPFQPLLKMSLPLIEKRHHL